RLTSAARMWLFDVRRSFQRWQRQVKIADAALTGNWAPTTVPPRQSTIYRPLERVVLTDGLNRTLFEEVAAHRKEEHRNRETGWMLFGHRTVNEAIVLATLPAGAHSDAGVAHVLFDRAAQAVAFPAIHEKDRRLTALGVVHTHPGSLRHPSDGDYQGDSEWV